MPGGRKSILRFLLLFVALPRGHTRGAGIGPCRNRTRGAWRTPRVRLIPRGRIDPRGGDEQACLASG
jgi:hypothetical protein